MMKPLYIILLLTAVEPALHARDRVEWEAFLPEERAKVLFAEEDRLYALGGLYAIPYSTLYCLDAETGEINWRFYIEVSEDAFEPFLYRDSIYWGTESGAFYALGKHDGSLRWAFALEGKYRVKNVRYMGKFLLHDRDGYIIFLDLLQGDKTKAYINQDFRWHNPVRVWKYLFYTNGSGDLVCIHAGTGQMIWKIFENLQTGPFQGEEAVYYGSTLETLFCLHPLNGVRKWVSVWFPHNLCEEDGITAVQAGNEILLLETATGEVLHHFSLPNRITGLNIHHGTVAAADASEGKIYCFDAETGEEKLAWSVPALSPGSEAAEPSIENADFNFILTERRLYVGTYDGRILKIDRGPQ